MATVIMVPRQYVESAATKISGHLVGLQPLWSLGTMGSAVTVVSGYHEICSHPLRSLSTL